MEESVKVSEVCPEFSVTVPEIGKVWFVPKFEALRTQTKVDDVGVVQPVGSVAVLMAKLEFAPTKEPVTLAAFAARLFIAPLPMLVTRMA